MSYRHANDVRAAVELADGARLTLDGEFERIC